MWIKGVKPPPEWLPAIVPGKAAVTAQSLESLPPTWEAHGKSLAQTRYCSHLGKEDARSLSVTVLSK